jgi:hypothetical protein
LRKYFLSIMLSAAALAVPLAAAEDCPFGQVNDHEPGKCGLYEDTDRDSICDLSQKAAPVEAARTAVAVPVPEPVRQASPGNQDPVKTITTAPIPAPDPPAPAPAPARPSPLRQRYPVWQVFIAVVALAAVTELLCARHQRLTLPLQAAWNWALALSFLLTAATGVVYAYPALLARFSFNLGTWHSVPGLVMIAAGAYHTVRRFGCLWRGAGSWFSRRGGSCGG